MEATSTLISPTELRKLLSSMISSMIHENLPVCMRYRALGQLWRPGFLKVLKVDDNGSVLFYDTSGNRFVSLPDLRWIVQFELDGKIYPFQPNTHYEVEEDLSNPIR